MSMARTIRPPPEAWNDCGPPRTKWCRAPNEKGGYHGTPVVLLARIAEVLADAGSTDNARKVAGAIVDATWRDIARMSIATAQAGRGEIEAALKTADEIQGADQKGEALKNVVAAQVAASDLEASADAGRPDRAGELAR